MEKYKFIENVLGGIYGSQIGLSEEDATIEYIRGLQYEPFRNGIKGELIRAFSDEGLSWVEMMDKYEVAYFETEESAKSCARDWLWLPAHRLGIV